MKTLKMIHAVLVLIVVSYLAGCSDQLVSSGDKNSDQQTIKSKKINENVTTELQSKPSLKTIIKIKPNKSYTFDYSNTGFVKFNSIDIVGKLNVVKADNPCNDLYVFTNEKSDALLNCQSANFDLKTIGIMNTSLSMVELEVVLTGVKHVRNVED